MSTTRAEFDALVDIVEDIAIKCHADPNIRVSFQSTIDRLSAKPRR